MTYRYSAIKAYQTCPRQYQFRYIENRQATNNLMQRGSIAHEIIEKYSRYCTANKYPTDYTYLEKLCEETKVKYPEYNNFWDGFFNNLKEIIIPSNIVGFERNIKLDNRFKIPNIHEVIYREPYFSMTLDFSYFDTEGNVIIRDWKTGYKTEADYLQTEIYAWGLSKIIPNLEKVYVEFVFINELWYYVTQKKEITDFNAIEEKVKLFISEIEKDKEYNAKGGEHCNFCPYVKACLEKSGIDIRENLLLRDIEINKDNAPIVADFYERLLLFTDFVKDKIEGYCRENGRIETRDKIYGININPKLYAPITKDTEDKKQEIIKILKKMGLNPQQFSKIDLRKLNKILPDLTQEQQDKIEKAFYKNPVADCLKNLKLNPIDYMNLQTDLLTDKTMFDIQEQIKPYLVSKPNDKLQVTIKDKVTEKQIVEDLREKEIL